MKLYIILQILAMLVFVAALAAAAIHYVKYRRVILYYGNNRDYIKETMQKYRRKMLPKPSMKRYTTYEALILEAGWKLSVEDFFIIRYLLLIMTLVFFISMHNTNMIHLINDIKGDVNFKRPNVATEVSLPQTQENTRIETTVYNQIDNGMHPDKSFFTRENQKNSINRIKATIVASGQQLIENPEIMAVRIYNKLCFIYNMEHDAAQYSLIGIIVLIAYWLPVFIAKLKIRLIVDKKDWEIINLINIFIIFGMMPPYDIRLVLENMQKVAKLFSSPITKLYEGVKDGKGEKIFDEVLEVTENQELYDLIEIMKMSKTTGLLNEVRKLDARLESKLKKLEIQNIRKREAKVRYALIPITIMMMIIGMYFFYGTMEISNPANLNMLTK